MTYSFDAALLELRLFVAALEFLSSSGAEGAFSFVVGLANLMWYSL